MSCYFMHHEGMVDDSKWDLAAQIADVPLSLISILFGKACEHAAKQEDRGSLDGFDPRVIAARFREFTIDQVRRAVAALEEIRCFVGGRIAAWTKRGNPSRIAAAQIAPGTDASHRSASSSAERMRRKRERDSEKSRQGDFFGASHPVTSGVTSPVTCDASGNPPPAPPPREYIKNTPCSPPGGTRSARMQIVPRVADRSAAMQGEILLPIRGGRPRRLTAREQRQAEFRQRLADWVESEEARDLEAAHGRAA